MAEKNRDKKSRTSKGLAGVGLMIFLAFTNILGPFTTDIYLPALPSMSSELATSDLIINLTLSGYFAVFGIATLIFGPLSDRWGRRPITLVGIALYTAGSFACVFAPGATLLVVARALQATGSGAIIAASTAIVKDRFCGAQRARLLSLLQASIVIAPLIAPVVGAALLSVVGWRALFVLLGFLGLAGLIASLFLQESAPFEEDEATVRQSFQRMGDILREDEFPKWLVVMSIISLPFMAYLGLSSYIFINQFGLSEQVYSYYFALGSIFTLVGSLSYPKLSGMMRGELLARVLLLIGAISGVAMICIGPLSPLAFLITYSIMGATFTCLRPFVINVMLEKHPHNAGSVSSLINASHTLVSAFGLFVTGALAATPIFFGNHLLVLGITTVVTYLIAFLGFIGMLRRGYTWHA